MLRTSRRYQKQARDELRKINNPKQTLADVLQVTPEDVARREEARIQAAAAAQAHPAGTVQICPYATMVYGGKQIGGALRMNATTLHIMPSTVSKTVSYVYFNLAKVHEIRVIPVSDDQVQIVLHEKTIAWTIDVLSKVGPFVARTSETLRSFCWVEGPENLWVHAPDLEATPKPAVGTQPNLGSELAKLGELKQQGLLTDAEFAAAKERLLS